MKDTTNGKVICNILQVVFYFVCTCMYECYVHHVILHVYMFTMCSPVAQGDQKRMLAPLELELQRVVNCHMSAGGF